MGNTIVLGMQWGDEAKGKLVDILAENHKLIIRYQGGGNAGHTIVTCDKKYALHQVPSGILRGKQCVIGNIALDPGQLVEEIEKLKELGVDINSHNLIISNLANLTTAYDRELDSASCGRFGTTKRGIGPTYANKKTRTGLLVHDFFDVKKLEEKVRENTLFANHVLSFYNASPVNVSKVLEELLFAREKLLPFISKNIPGLIRYNEGSLLFEGAQGTLLDNDLGTYPYVTSSNTTIGAAFTGTGVYVHFDRVIGVLKAYTTRVGSGPFPTEEENETGERIRKNGGEFGTTTGRPRRCGWLDLFAAEYAVIANGIREVSLAKLDVLDNEEEIKLCVGYELDGKRADYFPVLDLERCIPVYETMGGWKCDTTGARSIRELPLNAKRYIDRIEIYLGIPITTIGVGNRRDQMVKLF